VVNFHCYLEKERWIRENGREKNIEIRKQE